MLRRPCRVSRRTACVAGLTLLAAARAVFAQTAAARVARVSFLLEPPVDGPIEQGVVAPFRSGLKEHGYVEGVNLVLTLRSAEGRNAALPDLASELLRAPPDVLVTAFPAAILAAKKATQSVPIVALSVDNPVEMGLAQSMAKPGGNITGISSWGLEMLAKRLQLIRELVPSARVVGVLGHPASGFDPRKMPLATYEHAIKAKIRTYGSAGPADMAGVFDAMTRDRVEGLLVLGDGNSYTHRERLNALCLQHRLPSVWGGRDFLTGGGLASYQSDFPAIFRRGAALVDAILKGRAPGDIPFEQATKLELVIDKRAARALGIVVPNALLLAADLVIE